MKWSSAADDRDGYHLRQLASINLTLSGAWVLADFNGINLQNISFFPRVLRGQFCQQYSFFMCIFAVDFCHQILPVNKYLSVFLCTYTTCDLFHLQMVAHSIYVSRIKLITAYCGVPQFYEGFLLSVQVLLLSADRDLKQISVLFFFFQKNVQFLLFKFLCIQIGT